MIPTPSYLESPEKDFGGFKKKTTQKQNNKDGVSGHLLASLWGIDPANSHSCRNIKTHRCKNFNIFSPSLPDEPTIASDSLLQDDE